MNNWFSSLCLAILTAGVLWIMARWHQLVGIPDAPPPVPVVVPVPTPAPQPEPQPVRKPRRPRGEWEGESGGPAAEAIVGVPAAFLSPPIGAQPNAPDGTEPEIDFPDDQWMKNIGSKLDGAGMCVFTSWEHTCRWAGLEEFRGFRDWCASKYRGGGYPEKLAKLIKDYCTAKNIPRERFDPDRDVVQYEGNSTELLEAALKANLLPSTTLYHSPRYGRGTIYHMVNCAHLDGERGAILDNNFKPLEWASRAETISRMKLSGRIWVAVLLRPGPPLLPRN